MSGDLQIADPEDKDGSDAEKARKSDDSDASEKGDKEEMGTAALFGDLSDSDGDDSDASVAAPKKRAHVLSEDEGSERGRRSRSRSREADDGDLPAVGEGGKIPEEEEEEPQIPETKIEAEIPKINTDLGRQIHFVKLPNFLSVETRPFERETYEDEVGDEETLDEEGRARLKLKVENTIRWQVSFDDEGNAIRESNAKLVRWSDGSLSMHLGGEVFDVYKQPLQGDHNHLFIRQGTGLQGQAVFRTKLSFRPHSTDSFTHKKILSSLADRSLKKSHVKVLTRVIKDPDAKRDELFKRDEDRLKASMRRQTQQKKVKASNSGKAGLTKNYLEDDDDDNENSFSIAKIKNQAKNTKKSAASSSKTASVYSESDSEDSDVDAAKAKKGGKRPAVTDSEDEKSSKGGSSPGSDSDASSEPKAKKRKVSSDSDSD